MTEKLDEGYKWSAGSTDPATIEWSVAKADKVKVTVDDMNAYVGDEVSTPTRSVMEQPFTNTSLRMLMALMARK